MSDERRTAEERQAQRDLILERWYARFLDLRFIIALLFVIFGVLVTVSGLTATSAEIDQAAGINISLWTGVACLMLSAAFGLWVIKAPPEVPHHVDDENGNGNGNDSGGDGTGEAPPSGAP